MTKLHSITPGINQFCGPAVISALTGMSVDDCANAISRVNGKTIIKAVDIADIIKTLKNLRFEVTEQRVQATTLFGIINILSAVDGIYIIGVPKHVIAIRVENNQVLICDNHTKTPIDARGSARLSQKVDVILKCVALSPPKFLKSEIKIVGMNRIGFIQVVRNNYYENKEDNTNIILGQFTYKDDEELREIIGELTLIATGRI